MAFQGEYFIDRYGTDAAAQTPPIAKMLAMRIPVGAGTDATRVASYNPWVSLYWMVSGKTVGGTSLYAEANRLNRLEALRRYTLGSAWFSGEEDKKGAIAPGYLTDLVVLSSDYFSVPEEEIKRIESVLTVVDGKIVHGADDFGQLAPAPVPVLPNWSPVKEYGGYYRSQQMASVETHSHASTSPSGLHTLLHRVFGKHGLNCKEPIWGLDCECFAF